MVGPTVLSQNGRQTVVLLSVDFATAANLKSDGKFTVKIQIIYKLVIETFVLSHSVLSQTDCQSEYYVRKGTFPLFFYRLFCYIGYMT